MPQCHDRTQAVARVQDAQPYILDDIASLEGWQMRLDGAAAWLPDEDAEHLRDAAHAIRRAISELRDAESLLGDINRVMRVRESTSRETNGVPAR